MGQAVAVVKELILVEIHVVLKLALQPKPTAKNSSWVLLEKYFGKQVEIHVVPEHALKPLLDFTNSVEIKVSVEIHVVPEHALKQFFTWVKISR